jgi:hypothetical protein
MQKQFGNGFFALIADANARIYRYDWSDTTEIKSSKLVETTTSWREPWNRQVMHHDIKEMPLSSKVYFDATLLITALCFG